MGFFTKDQGVEIRLGGLHVFQQLMLDGQAMAIPTGDIQGIKTLHGLVFDDHVLEDLVKRVADMDMAIGIGRPVVQNKRRRPFALLADTLIDLVILPAGQDLRLFLG